MGGYATGAGAAGIIGGGYATGMAATRGWISAAIAWADNPARAAVATKSFFISGTHQ